MANVISEYLVSLSLSTEPELLQKFKTYLSDADRAVASYSSGIARSLLEAQGAIVGSFASVSAGILGVVDKAAMMDQSFRLAGLRMMMNTSEARTMTMVTKALGESLEELIWDPESSERARMMAEHIGKLNQQLSGGFEGDMKAIRDVRAQFSLLGIDVQYLGMQFADSIFKKFNPDGGGMLDWISKKVNEFEDNIPKLADELSTYLKPALTTTWEIFKDLGEVVKDGALAFTNIIGLLSGDNAIEGATFSFQKLAGAFEDIGKWMMTFLKLMAEVEKALAHFASGASLVLSGHFNAASAEFKQMRKDFEDMGSTLVEQWNWVKSDKTHFADTEDKDRKDALAALGTQDPVLAAIIARDNAQKAATAGMTPDTDTVARESVQGSENERGPLATGYRPADNKTGNDWGKMSDSKTSGIPSLPMGAGIEPRYYTGQEWLNHIGFWDRTKTDSQGHESHKTGFEWLRDMWRKRNDRPPQSDVMPNTSMVHDVDTTVAPDGFEAIAKVIKGQEGWFKGSISERNNNEANQVYVGQPGAEKSTDALRDAAGNIKGYYAKFKDEAAGHAADIRQLGLWAQRGLTIQQTAEQMEAGGPQKDMDLYAQLMAKAVGLSPNDKLAMAMMAGGDRGRGDMSVDTAYSDAPRVADDHDPKWFDALPLFMREVPKWYDVSPPWMQLPRSEHADAMMRPGDLVPPSVFSGAIKIQQPDWQVPDMQRLATAAPIQNTTVNHTTTIDVGGIYVTQPGADYHEIQRATEDGIKAAMDKQILGDLVQLNPTW